MNTSKYKYAVSAIGIGLIGSALWSFIYDYLFPACTRYFINVSSRFSNAVFINISSHDLISIHQSTNFLITMLLVSAALLLFMWSFLQMKKIKDYYKNSESKVQECSEQNLIKENQSEDNSHENVLKSFEKKDKFFKRFYLFSSILLPSSLICFIVVNIFSVVTTKYIYDSITYFDYLLYVNAENLDDKTERRYKTEFTQIHNSQDYHKLIVELEKLAFANGLTVYPIRSIRSKEELKNDHPEVKAISVNGFVL